MEIKDKMTVREVILLLNGDILNKTNLIAEFILKNYGDNIYSVIKSDIKFPTCSEIALKDNFLEDIINIIYIGNPNKQGQEAIGIYHSSPKNQATASYQFVSSYDKEHEWSFRFVDVFDANGETYINHEGGQYYNNNIINHNYQSVKVASEDIKKYRQDNIANLICHINENSVKILSKKIYIKAK